MPASTECPPFRLGESRFDQLWEAQKIKQAIIHPDTGEKIPMPFRMSGKGVGLNLLIKRAEHFSPATRILVQRFIPFPAVGLYVRLPLLQKCPRLGLPVHSMVCLCTFGLALPVAISLFPQNSQIHVSELEPEIAAATECKILTYNKGL
ncbi:sideroflexin-5-like [Sinocyclocheilus grahami]|uniref:sideroflexin-5-like n=1 Tax=Sinocyclocheilus grahami TaxID=75366 RepID=UPI0007ACF29A|nr:PREDICTED: sideroflexin-5-like [Sinocyclocheilus grahami]